MLKTLKSDFSFLERIRNFYYTPCFLALQILIAGVLFVSEDISIAVVLISLASIVLVTSDDILPCLSIVFISGMVLSRFYGLDINSLLQYWPTVVMFGVSLILHGVLYPKKLRAGKLLFANVGVAIAVLLGGLGFLTFREYFDFSTIYYLLGLSVGLVVLYIVCFTYISPPKHIRIEEAFAKQLIAVCVMGIVMMATVVLPNSETFEWYIQWKNSLSSFLLLAMPFCFYMAVRAKFGVGYYLLGVGAYASMFLSYSRGGIIFGSIEFAACLLACVLSANTKEKKIMFYWLNAIMIVTFVLFIFPSEKFQELADKFVAYKEGEVRQGLFALAWRNFINNPIFGVGISYAGNDLFKPKPGSMFWYHSTLFQVLGSMGMVGVFAYSAQYIMRFRVIFAKKRLFNLFFLISFLGFEAYQLVDVGEFSPMPFTLILVIFFVVCEHANNKEKIIAMYPRKTLKNDKTFIWRFNNY